MTAKKKRLRPGVYSPEGLLRKRADDRWLAMIARCTNPDHKSWSQYGGRGIEVCARWLASFDDYWLDVGSPPRQGMTLDRVCARWLASFGNVRWATPAEQARNMRNAPAFRTHCPQGHPYDEINTYIKPNGARDCRVCRAEASRRSAARRRAA